MFSAFFRGYFGFQAKTFGLSCFNRNWILLNPACPCIESLGRTIGRVPGIIHLASRTTGTSCRTIGSEALEIGSSGWVIGSACLSIGTSLSEINLSGCKIGMTWVKMRCVAVRIKSPDSSSGMK